MVAIFLSHSSRDNDIAREVQEWLLQQGYGPVFVDFAKDDGLIGGKPWWPQLSENLKRAKIFLALVSKAWLRSIPCHEELTIARHEGKPVIVLKIGPCTLGSHLEQLHYIDFLQRAPDAWQRLAQALEEAGASPMLFRPDPGRPPFPGLSAFDVEDAAQYFGREAEIADVLERLDRLRLSAKRLLVIAGPSGSGKSSLLRAGVLARLRRRSAEWIPVKPFRPGSGREQGVLRPLEETCRDWYGTPKSRASLRKLVEEKTADPARFSTLFRQVAGEPGAVPLISIDQGEELLATDSKEEAEAFLRALARLLSGQGPVMGLLTIRSDLLGMLQQHPWIGPLIVDDVYALRPMPRERYALLIDGPIAQYSRYVQPGAAVDSALRDALIDSADGADALPLIAFALGTLWEEHGQEGRLILDHLEELGGVGGAVAAVAEDLIAAAPASPQGLDLGALRRAFVPGLAGVTASGETVRRRLPVEDIPAAVRPLLDRFVQSRLLVRDEGPGGRAHLEVAHEALLRQWPRLVEWIQQDREALRSLEELARAATAWQQATRAEDLLVHRGDILARSLQVVATDLFERRFAAGDLETITAYLAACKALERERKRRQLAAEITLATVFFDRAQREADRLHWIEAAALFGASLEANPYVRAAEEAREICDSGELARARSLAWRARSGLQEVLPHVLFGFERRIDVRAGFGARLFFHSEGDVLTMIAGEEAHEVDLCDGRVSAWTAPSKGILLDFSPGEGIFLLLREWQEASVVARDTGTVLSTVRLEWGGKASHIEHGLLLPAGAGAILLGAQACFLIDFEQGKSIDLRPVITRESSLHLYSLVLLDRDRLALAGASDVHILDLRRKVCAHRPSGQILAIKAMAFDAVTDQVALGGINQDIRLWGLESSRLKPIGSHQGSVTSLAVLERERLLVSTGLDGRAAVWDLATESHKLDLPSQGGALRYAAASPDNKRVAILEEGKTITVWRKLDHGATMELPHGNSITGAAYNPVRPGQLVSVSFVGEVCAAVWVRGEGEWSKADLGIRAPLRGVAMASAGDLFALCGDSAEVRIFSDAGRQLRTFRSEGDFAEEGRGRRSDGRRFGFVRNVSVARTSRHIAWVAPTGRIWFGEIVSGKIRPLASDAEERFSMVCFSPAEDALVAVAEGGATFWVDARGQRALLLEDASDENTLGRGTPLAFSPDGKKLAIATSDSSITILSTEDPGSQIRLQPPAETFKPGWSEAVGALAFDPQGAFLVAAGSRQSGDRDPRTVRLWDVETGDPLLRIIIESDCLAVAVDPFSDTLCIGTDRGLLLLPFDRSLLSSDPSSIREQMERYLGAKAEDLL